MSEQKALAQPIQVQLPGHLIAEALKRFPEKPGLFIGQVVSVSFTPTECEAPYIKVPIDTYVWTTSPVRKPFKVIW